MCARKSGDSTWPATSRRLRSFQAGSTLRKMAGAWAFASYQPTPKPSPLVVSTPRRRGDSGRSGSARACRAAPRGGSGSPSRRASGTSSAPFLLRVDLRRTSISRPIEQDLHLTGYESSIRLYRSPHTILYGAGWPSLALLLQHLLML